MQVEVSDWARERITRMVAEGEAQDERDAIDRALAALEASDAAIDRLLGDWTPQQMRELQQSLDAAFADLSAGKGIPMTREVIEDIRREGRQQAAAHHE